MVPSHTFKRWSQWLLALILTFLAVPVAAVSAFVFAYGKDGAILPGVQLGDIPLGRLHPAVARQLLHTFADSGVTLTLTAQGHPLLTLEYKELGIDLDVEKTLARAQAVGRYGSPWQRISGVATTLLHGQAISPVWRIDEGRLRDKVRELAAALTAPPRNARFLVDEAGHVFIQPHKISVHVEPEALRQAVLGAVRRGQRRVEVPGKVQVPPITESVLRSMGSVGRLASFETRFDPAERNRAVNIRLSAQALDGVMVPPGDVLSFNDVVGPRSSERGYRPAPVIVNGRYEDDFGGGVCQVSTTLYNAGLLSGLQVLERARHSLPVSYVPPGRDAAVVYGVVDLKLRNPFPYPLLVQTEVRRDRVRIEIYGGGSQGFGRNSEPVRLGVI